MNDARRWKEVMLDSNSDVWDRSSPVEGMLVKIESDIGPNKSRMYTIKTAGGEVKVWGSTVLDDKLLGVPRGTYVKIDYEGKLTSKKGTQYHSYKVFVDETTMHDESPVDDREPLPDDSDAPMNLDEIGF